MQLQKQDYTGTFTRPTLGFRLQAFQDARSAQEAKQRSDEQATADRLNGLLDAYEPILAKALGCDGQSHVDYNAQAGVVAVANLSWPERVANITDGAFDIYASATNGTMEEVDMMSGKRSLLHRNPATGTLTIFSPQDDSVYSIQALPEGGFDVTSTR